MGERRIAGIYVKGSSLKDWDSPIDYVPTLSDVDIHVLFDSRLIGATERLSLAEAITLSRLAEELFRNRVPDPVHIPRIQMVDANRLYQDPDYIPSPIETVEERFGIPYPRRYVDLDLSRAIAVRRTLDPETVAYLARLGDAVADLTGPHLRRVLRDLSWRVSPTGPRILELAGVPFHTSWTSNRTKIIALLESTGETDLAEAYAVFYLQSWNYCLSRDADGEPARRAILAAARLLSRAAEIARSAHVENADKVGNAKA